MKKTTNNRIDHVDRYGSYTGDYVYYVHYENGDIDQYASENLPREVKLFMSAMNSTYEFRKSKSGLHYHRFCHI